MCVEGMAQPPDQVDHVAFCGFLLDQPGPGGGPGAPRWTRGWTRGRGPRWTRAPPGPPRPCSCSYCEAPCMWSEPRNLFAPTRPAGMSAPTARPSRRAPYLPLFFAPTCKERGYWVGAVGIKGRPRKRWHASEMALCDTIGRKLCAVRLEVLHRPCAIQRRHNFGSTAWPSCRAAPRPRRRSRARGVRPGPARGDRRPGR